jgi:outer membrane protein OmpA-like peptidoglycan-associated protein
VSKHLRWLLLSSGLLLAAALAGCATPSGLNPAQIAVLQQQGFSPGAGSSWQFGVADKILFASNSDRLDPDTATRIEDMGRILASVDITKLRIEGHTDEYGTDAYNAQLSLRRAEAVADEFEHVGFVAANLIIRGLGKTDPVGEETTPEGQAENRRVSIIVPAGQ